MKNYFTFIQGPYDDSGNRAQHEPNTAIASEMEKYNSCPAHTACKVWCKKNRTHAEMCFY